MQKINNEVNKIRWGKKNAPPKIGDRTEKYSEKNWRRKYCMKNTKLSDGKINRFGKNTIIFGKNKKLSANTTIYEKNRQIYKKNGKYKINQTIIYQFCCPP